MRPYERWTESYLDGKLFESNYDLFERRLATPELLTKLETLFEPLSQLKNQSTSAKYGVEHYEFYFRVPRGSFEESEYGEYDDLSEKEEREYREIFNRSYRKKWYWHTLTFSRDHYRGDVFYGILIGRRTLLSASDGKGDDAKRDLKTIAECEWIKPLGGLLQALMKSIQEGTYESLVSKNLDYEMRSGEILYKDYWKLYPKEGKAHYRRYEGVDIGLFHSYWKSGVMSEKNATHFKRLSANQYCRYFCIAASALGLNPSKEKTHQQNYKWASDGRTLGLDLIDGDNYEEFDRWYASQRFGFDHAFEIRYWENGTRIDLRIEKDRDGYFLYLTCGPANEAGIKVYLALAKEGVFAHIFEPKDYLSYFNGTNLRSVDSEENSYGHPFPASKKRAFIEAVKWDPLELVQLKKAWRND